MSVTANQVVAGQDLRARRKIPVKASAHLYSGTLVFGHSGYADSVISGTSYPFLGIAVNEADNSSGADGDISVEVWQQGVLQLPLGSAVVTDIETLVYGVDNYTINRTKTSQPLVGKVLEYLSTTTVMVGFNVGANDLVSSLGATSG